MDVTLQFTTGTPQKWTIRKEFNDEAHMNNFIAYIMRTKENFYLDEIWIHK